jgi:hypothetical protein
MRANYTSVLQVLGESGCLFCRFLKDFQAAALQSPGKAQIRHLCNSHTWGLLGHAAEFLVSQRGLHT